MRKEGGINDSSVRPGPVEGIYEVPEGKALRASVRLRSGRAIAFGVVDNTDRPVPASGVFSTIGRVVWRPDWSDNSAPPERLAEPCLFAGVLNNMFGHNLTTGLGRVWALDHLPKETGLLYVVRMGSPRLLAQLQIRMGKILGCFGVERPVRVVASSVSAPVLYTALDKYGENYLGGASYEFVSWVHGRLRPYITADVESGNRLYVTRANVSRLQGRFACEDRLSENLARSGYKRFAPEEHSLQEQLEAYSRAEKLIFAEGSALHFFAFVKKPVQQVAVIQRREALPPLISRQIHAFDPQPVQFVNSIERVVFPKTLETNRAISILDFQRCKEILRATGFVDDRAEWEFPKAREIEGSVAEGRPGEEFLDEQGWNEWRETVRKEKISRRMARQAGSGA